MPEGRQPTRPPTTISRPRAPRASDPYRRYGLLKGSPSDRVSRSLDQDRCMRKLRTRTTSPPMTISTTIPAVSHHLRAREGEKPCRESSGSGSSGNECCDDVAGVSVEVLSCSVVAGGGPWVGVSCCDLHVWEGDAGVECCGDQAVPQRVRCDAFGDPCTSTDPSHNSRCTASVHRRPGR